MGEEEHMNDREQIIQLYKEMYTAMINKDKAELERVHDDSFVLVHMTGMRQPKEAYIDSILDGTLMQVIQGKGFMPIEGSGDTV